MTDAALSPERAVELVRLHGGLRAAARVTGHAKTTLRRRLAEARGAEDRGAEFDMAPLPDETAPPEEIWALAEERYERKKAAELARKWIEIKVNIEGPFGLAHMGDKHLDNKGTDLRAVREARETILATDGMLAGFAGDLLDNWPSGGRLAALYAETGMTREDGRELGRYHIEMLRPKLVYFVGGNHDVMLGPDLMRWLKDYTVGACEQDEARIKLVCPNGRAVKVIIRHKWRGTSQWNVAHGVSKAAQMGVEADILIGAHTHVSGYNIIQNPDNGRLSHCLQVSSYKTFDGYAKQEGFRSQGYMPCPVTIIDPDASDLDLVTVVRSPQKAAQILTAMRDS